MYKIMMINVLMMRVMMILISIKNIIHHACCVATLSKQLWQ